MRADSATMYEHAYDPNQQQAGSVPPPPPPPPTGVAPTTLLPQGGPAVPPARSFAAPTGAAHAPLPAPVQMPVPVPTPIPVPVPLAAPAPPPAAMPAPAPMPVAMPAPMPAAEPAGLVPPSPEVVHHEAAQEQAQPAHHASPAYEDAIDPSWDQPDGLHETVIHGASGRWFSPGTALVAAMSALAWRLVSAYAHDVLPDKLTSGEPLDRFDTIVEGLPLVGGQVGMIFGYVLIATAFGLLVAGWRMHVREPLLQLAVAAVALLALLAPMLAG